MHQLWSFFSSVTTGLQVTCLSWNVLNPDLLAVGYGPIEDDASVTIVAEDPSTAAATNTVVGGGGGAVPGAGVGVGGAPGAQPDGAQSAPGLAPTAAGGLGGVGKSVSATPVAPQGAIGFWSLLNPLHPQRLYRTKRGVTSLEFAPESGYAHLLAAGFMDGAVAVYDVRDASGRVRLLRGHEHAYSCVTIDIHLYTASFTLRCLNIHFCLTYFSLPSPVPSPFLPLDTSTSPGRTRVCASGEAQRARVGCEVGATHRSEARPAAHDHLLRRYCPAMVR